MLPGQHKVLDYFNIQILPEIIVLNIFGSFHTHFFKLHIILQEIKTSVKNNNQNPVFNEVFKFGVRTKYL